MCAALWTRKLSEGLPGIATERVAAGEARSLAYASCPSPFGTVHLAASAQGICAVSLYESEARFRSRLAPARWDLADGAGLLAQAAQELAEYFAGARRTFDVPLDLSGATSFDRRVLAAIAAIPYGETRTYGQLARELGCAGAARAVGHACGRNPVPLLIACHRVVRSDGGLAGFGAGGTGVKARLLALERGGFLA